MIQAIRTVMRIRHKKNVSLITYTIGGTVTRLFRLSNAIRKSAKASRTCKIGGYRDDEEANNAIKETPLHIAVKRQNVELIKTLIAAGADRRITQLTILASVKLKTVWDLAESNRNIIEALKQEWSPQYHEYIPKAARDAIKCTLLVAKRQRWVFDNVIMYTIFSFITFGWPR